MLFHVILRSAMFGFCCVFVSSVRVISYSISCRSNLFQVNTIYFMLFHFISCQLMLFHFSAAVGGWGAPSSGFGDGSGYFRIHAMEKRLAVDLACMQRPLAVGTLCLKLVVGAICLKLAVCGSVSEM